MFSLKEPGTPDQSGSLQRGYWLPEFEVVSLASSVHFNGHSTATAVPNHRLMGWAAMPGKVERTERENPYQGNIVVQR